MDRIKYSIIIPTLNEGRTIYKVISSIPPAIRKESEVIVVDGLSTDDTVENSRRGGARVVIETQSGKGVAIIRGLNAAKGEFAILIDGDGSMNPQDISRLASAVKGHDLVIGSRFLGRPMDVGPVHFMGNFVHNKAASLLFLRRITDINSGFKAIRIGMARRLPIKSKGFEIEAEILLETLKMGGKVKEIPISTAKREYGQAKISSLRDGFRILLKILEIRMR